MALGSSPRAMRQTEAITETHTWWLQGGEHFRQLRGGKHFFSRR